MTRHRGTLVLLGCLTAGIVSTAWTALAQVTAGPRDWRWGAGDEQGAGNLITSDSILEALAQVTRGEVIELSHDVAGGAPFIPGLQPPYGLRMYLTSGASLQGTNRLGVNVELVEMTMHVSTHVDALGHVSIGNTLYAGAAGEESVSDNGLSHAGIDTAPPFIARAVLIDVAAYKGVDRLDPGYAIQPDDLEGALQAQGVDVSEGTIVLIHTGSDETFLERPEAHAESTPGLSALALEPARRGGGSGQSCAGGPTRGSTRCGVSGPSAPARQSRHLHYREHETR